MDRRTCVTKTACISCLMGNNRGIESLCDPCSGCLPGYQLRTRGPAAGLRMRPPSPTPSAPAIIAMPIPTTIKGGTAKALAWSHSPSVVGGWNSDQGVPFEMLRLFREMMVRGVRDGSQPPCANWVERNRQACSRSAPYHMGQNASRISNAQNRLKVGGRRAMYCVVQEASVNCARLQFLILSQSPAPVPGPSRPQGLLPVEGLLDRLAHASKPPVRVAQLSRARPGRPAARQVWDWFGLAFMAHNFRLNFPCSTTSGLGSWNSGADAGSKS